MLREQKRMTNSHKEAAKRFIRKNKKVSEKNLPNLSGMDIFEWKKTVKPKINGREQTFLAAPFWTDIYKDNSSQIFVIGGRQIFKSTCVGDFLMYWATTNNHSQCCYASFDRINKNGFLHQRFQHEMIEQSPILSQFPRSKLGNNDEVSLKNGSTIYFIISHNDYVHVEGKSLDLIILDEAQYQPIEQIGKITQTMMQTRGKLKLFGIGGPVGSAYHNEWLKTNQCEWVYDNDYWRDALQFDENGLIHGQYLNDVLKGTWVAQKPENSAYPGYHIPQTIFPTIPLTKKDAIEKYKIDAKFSIEYQKEHLPFDKFEEHVMGNFYKSATNPITPEMVRACMKNGRDIQLLTPVQIKSLKEQYGNKIKISMGVDFGSAKNGHTVIVILIKWQEKGLIQLAHLDQRNAEHQIIQAENINKLFHNSLCDTGVGDLGYGATQIKLIQDGGIGQTNGEHIVGIGSSTFVGCRSVSDLSQGIRHDVGIIDEHGDKSEKYSLDKTWGISKLINLFENPGKFVIPFHYNYEYQTSWLVSELSSISKVNISGIDTRQNAKLEYNHPPDAAMAIIYALIALDHNADWNWVSM